ncbi:hypothetical protein AVEN_79057-1 [Araneus ventricosus]|uniref:Uncharacterized protein n=1 Tax=Araneus ventricosus TaxID=182803 RepID=A0A4Y2IJB8_ARAVE|nr:hypothetical protein AVEN_79057-1 [Araneus ventricosus]
MIEGSGRRLPREPYHFCLKTLWRRVLSNATLRSLGQYLEPIVIEIVSLAKIWGLEVDSNNIDICGRAQPRWDHRRAYGVALCFTARSYGSRVCQEEGG